MMTVFHWSDGRLRTGLTPQETLEALSSGQGMLWIDLEATGAPETAFLTQVCRAHPLVAEDCVADSKIPKVNAYADLVHMVIHGSSPPAASGALRTRELDVLWGERFLLTWHAHSLRSINAVRERCLKEPGAFLGPGPSRLLYQILDVLVDNWFPFIDVVSQHLGALERRLTTAPQDAVLRNLQGFNREVVQLLRIVDAQRAVFDRMSREEVPFVPADVRPYFRNLYDRAVILHGHLELFREQIHAARESCLLIVSNTLNKVMKTLTVVTTVFMSMTVVTGIYGMNFRRMPELDWPWGYPAALGVMLLAGGGTYWWIRRKGWL